MEIRQRKFNSFQYENSDAIFIDFSNSGKGLYIDFLKPFYKFARHN